MKKEIKFSLVYRDMWQSSGKYQPRADQLVRIAPLIIEMGCFSRVETNGGAFEQVNLLYGENPNKAVRAFTKPFHEAGIQTHMLDRGLNGLRMYPVPADVRRLMYKVKHAQGVDITRIFCGLNKGRKKILDSIQKKMVENNLLYHFHVVDEQLPVEEQKPRLSYQENLEYISSCKAVLDVLQEGQDGMTLRVMEALFFQKKLITNQLSLVKADFYHPNNIFIIGKDDWNNLKSFMNSPVFHISEEVKYKYDFFSWIERFGEKASL